jgi:type IV secretory pathway TrbF-like protein
MAAISNSPQSANFHEHSELNGKAGSPADDPSRAAQIASLFDAERAWQAYDSTRRWLSGAICVAGALSVAVVVLAFKDQHDVAVYWASPKDIALAAGAVQGSRIPQESWIENALQRWVERVRNADSDLELMRQNAHLALVTTAKDSPAAQQLTAFLQSDQNPADIGQHVTRGVASFIASPVSGTHSYLIGWSETVVPHGKAPQPWHCTGSIGIAPPLIPTDPAIGQINPAGVYVTGYSLHCVPGTGS